MNFCLNYSQNNIEKKNMMKIREMNIKRKNLIIFQKDILNNFIYLEIMLHIQILVVMMDK